MSYLRWMPQDSDELRSDAVARLDARIRWLEEQAADAYQTFGGREDTMWAYANDFPGWLSFIPPPITNPTYNPDLMPFADYTATITIPTNESFVYVCWGLEPFFVSPGQPNNDGTLQGPDFVLKLNGAEIETKSFMTMSTWQTLTWNQGVLSLPQASTQGWMNEMRPIQLDKGTHTFSLSLKTNRMATAGATLWFRDRFIRGFAHG